MTGLVLVIEREESMREALNDLLTISGLEAYTAVSSEEGLQLLTRVTSPINILILNVRGPDDEALELLPVFRQRQPQMKVILTSGYAEHMIVSQLGPDTAVKYLRKPYNSEALLQKISDISA